MTPKPMAELLASGAVSVSEPAPVPKAPRPFPKKKPTKDHILDKQRRELTRLDALHNTLAERVAALIEDVTTLKDVSEAAGALDRLGRITDRLIALERQAHGLDRPTSTFDADFANLLRKAWERAYGTTPPDFDPIP